MSVKTMEGEKAEEPEISKFRNYLSQWLAVGSLGILLAGFGSSLGYPTILIPALSKNDSNEDIYLDDEGISWISSLNLICVPIGCIFSGSLISWIGRKKTMLLVNIPFGIAWLLFHFATQPWQVYAALCLTGVSGGLLEAPSTTYLAEVCQPNIRGMLSAMVTGSVTLGMLFCIFVGTFMSWRNVALVQLSIPIITFICTIFVPDSPYWLISKNRLNDAKKSLAWVRGWTTVTKVNDEFLELCKILNKSTHVGYDNPNFKQSNDQIPAVSETQTPVMQTTVSSAPSITDNIKLYTKKNFLWPYAIIVITFFFGHSSGNSTLQVYAVKLFAALKSPISEYYATNLLGLVQLLGSIFNIVFVNMLGKRIINFISLLGGAICFCVVGTYAYLHNITSLEDTDPASSTEGTTWIPMVFLVLSAFLAYIGIKVLSWTLVGEIFSNETRSIGSGLSAAAAYILSFLVNLYFLDMVKAMTLSGVLWFYSGMGLFGFFVLYFILPETEGKTLYDISEHYGGRSKLSNKVYRAKNTVINGNVSKKSLNVAENGELH